jgi:hypothetical protein
MIRMFFPDPDLEFLPIPDPGVQKAPDPDPQHCFWTVYVYGVTYIMESHSMLHSAVMYKSF